MEQNKLSKEEFNKKSKEFQNKVSELEKDGVIKPPETITLTLSHSEFEKLEKIGAEDFRSVEEMIEDYLSNKITTYDEIGHSCANCGKHIKEKEQYYIQDSAIAIYEKIGGSMVEDKQNAWTDKILCMPCKEKEDAQRSKDFKDKVFKYNRSPIKNPESRIKDLNATKGDKQ